MKKCKNDLPVCHKVISVKVIKVKAKKKIKIKVKKNLLMRKKHNKILWLRIIMGSKTKKRKKRVAVEGKI